MSMLVPIVLVVGTKDYLQTNYGNVVHRCTKFHVCQLYMENILYSALARFPFFFDVICTQVHCLPKNNYENKFVRILLSMSLDSILVSSVVSLSGPYTELQEHVYLHCSCFGT